MHHNKGPPGETDSEKNEPLLLFRMVRIAKE